MLVIANTYANVGLVIFHYDMLRYKQSNGPSLYGMTEVCAIFISNNNCWVSRQGRVSPKQLYCHFNWSQQCS